MSSMRYAHDGGSGALFDGHMRAYEKITQLITIYKSHCFRVATTLVFAGKKKKIKMCDVDWLVRWMDGSMVGFWAECCTGDTLSGVGYPDRFHIRARIFQDGIRWRAKHEANEAFASGGTKTLHATFGIQVSEYLPDIHVIQIHFVKFPCFHPCRAPALDWQTCTP